MCSGYGCGHTQLKHSGMYLQHLWIMESREAPSELLLWASRPALCTLRAITPQTGEVGKGHLPPGVPVLGGTHLPLLSSLCPTLIPGYGWLWALVCDRKWSPPLWLTSLWAWVINASVQVHYLNCYVSPWVMAKVKTAVHSVHKSLVLINHCTVQTLLIGTIYTEAWQPAPSSNCRWRADADLCCAVKV